MSRPIPGAQAIEYRKGPTRFQRCSRCQQEQAQSSLVLDTKHAATHHAVMVGPDLVGIVCAGCVAAVEQHVLGLWPDKHAFPFVDAAGQLLPTPRCEAGHALVYAHDGSGMVCEQCDVERSFHGSGPVD